MTQTAFNFEALARHSDPPSSKRAARQAVEFAESHEETILRFVREYPGRTSKQLSSLCGLTDVQITRRGKGMEAKGLIRRTAEGSEDLKWWAV